MIFFLKIVIAPKTKAFCGASERNFDFYRLPSSLFPIPYPLLVQLIRLSTHTLSRKSCQQQPCNKQLLL